MENLTNKKETIHKSKSLIEEEYLKDNSKLLSINAEKQIKEIELKNPEDMKENINFEQEAELNIKEIKDLNEDQKKIFYEQQKIKEKFLNDIDKDLNHPYDNVEENINYKVGSLINNSPLKNKTLKDKNKMEENEKNEGNSNSNTLMYSQSLNNLNNFGFKKTDNNFFLRKNNTNKEQEKSSFDI